tara:strand:- start:98 stop:202 length:105 start_codon:yes stop_codon:yes gene_type:complete
VAELVQHKVLVQLLTEAAAVAAALEEILLKVVAV